MGPVRTMVPLREVRWFRKLEVGNSVDGVDGAMKRRCALGLMVSGEEEEPVVGGREERSWF